MIDVLLSRERDVPFTRASVISIGTGVVEGWTSDGLNVTIWWSEINQKFPLAVWQADAADLRALYVGTPAGCGQLVPAMQGTGAGYLLDYDRMGTFGCHPGDHDSDQHRGAGPA